MERQLQITEDANAPALIREPKGRTLWELVNNGRAARKKRPFYDAETLWLNACQYFRWCDLNEWQKVEICKYKGDVTEYEVPHVRPYTVSGLTAYLGVATSFFKDAEKELKEKVDEGKAEAYEIDLYNVICLINQTILSQQLEGAMIGAFNPTIVARLNGLTDNINVNNPTTPVVRVTVENEETRKNLELLEDII